MWCVFNLQQWSFKVIIWLMTQWISHLVLRFQRFFFCWETFCPEPPSSSKASCFFGIYFDFSPIANLCRGTQTAPAALLIIKEKSWPICSGSVWGVGVLHSNANLTKPPPQKNDFVPNPVWSWRSVQLPLSRAGCFFCLCKTNYNHNHIIRCIILLFWYKELAMPACIVLPPLLKNVF